MKGAYPMLYSMVSKMIRNTVNTRADENGLIFYFDAGDFPGLKKQPYAVLSSEGHTLSGYFYSYDSPRRDRIIIFEHGMGSGHRGYMTEIDCLAKHGYLVFAYDHTGCMESGGEGTGGFVHSLIDCNDVITALKNDPAFDGCSFSVIGHSWGGYAALNITALHPDITHIVAIAGFLSVPHMLRSIMRGFFAPFAKRMIREETARYPAFVPIDARETLQHTDADVLVIHSDDDQTVSCAANFDLLRAELSEHQNILFHKVTRKGHNPNYTEDALRYKDAFFKTYTKVQKKQESMTDEDKRAFRNAFDWNRMTAQDPEIWNLIFAFLDRTNGG